MPNMPHVELELVGHYTDMMADALSRFLEDQTRELDQADRRRIHDGIAAALTRLNATGAEAEHERNGNTSRNSARCGARD